jgi:cell division protein FtsW
MRRGKPDFWLILIAFILMGFGLVMVFSASYYKGLTDYGDSYYFFKRQLIWAVAGLFLFFVTANIPYTFYRRFVGTILLISILLLIAVLIPGVGVEVKGARRWIELGPMSFQPSELVKLSALIYTASIMTKKQPVMDSFKRAVLPPLIVLGLLCSLIVIEPHYSTTIIILSSCMVVIFCAGLRFRHFLFLASTGIPVLMWVMIMEPYRIKRLATLFNPWKNPTADGYQIIQSLYAIGPGGLTGSGLGNSIQKMAYLPEAHTDFIFAIVAEELGFIGGTLLITLFIALILRGIRISLRAPDQFGMLLGIGITSLIGIEALFNLGVVTAMLPVTGVPLPFISYGGSSLMLGMASLGILLNISRYTDIPAKQKKPQGPVSVPGR